jgi:hypothetical protein
LKERIRAAEKSAEPSDKFCDFTLNDFVVAFLAWLTVGVGLLQIYYLHGTLSATSLNAQAAKESADAAVKAQMPVIFPMVTRASMLPPPGWGSEHVPTLSLGLFNYGKTPAVIIGMKYELIVSVGLPESPPWEHPELREDREVIPPTENNVVVTIPYTFHRSLTKEEIAGHHMGVEQPGAKRFYLYGEIVYDDVFGYQHVKGFGRKIFPGAGRPPQAVRGVPKYEYYRRINRKTGREE